MITKHCYSWVIAYFIDYYYLSDHVDPTREDAPQIRIRPFTPDSTLFMGNANGICENGKKTCNADSEICHYIPATQMRELFAQQQNRTR